MLYRECNAYSIYFSAEYLNLCSSIEGSLYFINSYAVWINVKCIAYFWHLYFLI